MTQTEYKPIKITAEQYDELTEIKEDYFRTDNASFREVIDVLVEEYEENND
jgi:predicted CopG family antitoxin